MLISDLTAEANNVFLETFLSTDPRESPSKRTHLTNGPEKGFHNTQLKGSEQTGIGIDSLACHMLPEALHYQKVINARAHLAKNH